MLLYYIVKKMKKYSKIEKLINNIDIENYRRSLILPWQSAA